MKNRKWIKWVILLLVIVVALLAARYFGLFPKQDKSAGYSEMAVTQGDLTTYYHFDGLVRAPKSQTINATAPDTVERVYAAQNQLVEEGDRLYTTKSGGVVRADMDGELTSFSLGEGDVLTQGQMTAQIIDMNRLEARINVDEYDVVAVTPGTQVDVTVLATNTQYTGVVTALDKNGTASGDLSYYTATVALPQTQGVYPGMQVSAQVLRSHVQGANLLSADAIRFDEYNEPYVYVRGEKGEPVQQQVTVGISDGVQCEITSGLSAGDTVLVPSGMSLTDLMEQMRDGAQN